MSQRAGRRGSDNAATVAAQRASVTPVESDGIPAPHFAVRRSNGSRLRIDSGKSFREEPAHPGAISAPHFVDRRPDDVSAHTDVLPIAFEEFVYRYGAYADSYLATEPGRLHFWSRQRTGLVTYTRVGGSVLVGGGIIAPPRFRADLLGEFMEFCERQRWSVSFLSVAETDLPLFGERGFQITKWGEEPIVDLAECSWSGKAFEWVRRQTNFCLRHGLVASEVRPEQLSPGDWQATLDELRLVARESLARKVQSREMTFFEGSIEFHELGWRRLFVARSDHGQGRIEGFVVCNPMRNGAAWSTELYRHRSDSVRGTIAFLFHHLMQVLKSEGVESVSLCLDPARNCAAGRAGDSWLVRRGMMFTEKYLGLVFDVVGLRHFKSRFRPAYESRYVCSRPATSVSDLWAFVTILGAFQIHPGKLLRHAGERIRKITRRQTLAEQ